MSLNSTETFWTQKYESISTLQLLEEEHYKTNCNLIAKNELGLGTDWEYGTKFIPEHHSYTNTLVLTVSLQEKEYTLDDDLNSEV